MIKHSLQPEQKQSMSSVLSLISSLKAPFAAVLNLAGNSAKRPKEGDEYGEEEEWSRDLQMCVIHNGWLTASGRPKKMTNRNGLLPKLHRTPRVPKWAETENWRNWPPLPLPKSKSRF